MTAATALVALLVVAVVVGVARLVLQRRATPVAARARPWRFAVLLGLQPVCAALLYQTLVPPHAAAPAATIIVATRGSPLSAALAGGRLLALPEAPTLPGAERVPDLATVLRRNPGTALRVIGEGLEPRDRDAARGPTFAFDPPRPPRGLVRLDPPRAVAAGGVFRVGGQVGGIPGARVELIDPAGRRVDTATPGAGGGFVVTGTARAEGPAAFVVRVRDGTRGVEDAAVSVWTRAATPVRVLLLSGAPGPEAKYLRRWASDAGIDLHSQLAVGAGLTLGDAPLPIDAATLARFDLAVIDERSWAALAPGARAAMVEAATAGLGVLVRITGPLSDPAATALRSLGFAVTGGRETVPIALSVPAEDDAVGLARSGPGTTDAPAAVNRAAPMPPLSRWAVRLDATGATPLLRDAGGAPVALWRAAGRGRVGVWPLADSYQLVLAGRGDRYGELWSAAFATLARGRSAGALGIEPAVIGQRIALCGIAPGATVVDPDGAATPLIADPAAATCAGFWPRIGGWHQVRANAAGGKTTPFFVAAAAPPGVRAMANREATMRLASPTVATTAATATRRFDGSWPWFALWLVVSAALWWFERSRFGRVGAA